MNDTLCQRGILNLRLNELKESNETMKLELEEKPVEDDNADPDNQEQSNWLDDLKDNLVLIIGSLLTEEMAMKYRELTKKEAQMDEFLQSFDESKKKETEQLYNTRKAILTHLELISKAVERMNKDSDGGVKRGGSRDEFTVADLRKVEELERKVSLEYEALKEKRKKMKEELVVFSDLEGLKRKSELRKQQLAVEKQNLSRYKDNIKYELKALQSQFEAIQAQLFDNETHTQVNRNKLEF